MENKTYIYTFGNITVTGSKELIDQVNEDCIADAYNNPDNYEPRFIDIDSVVPLDSIDNDDVDYDYDDIDEIAWENEQRELHYGVQSEFHDQIRQEQVEYTRELAAKLS